MGRVFSVRPCFDCMPLLEGAAGVADPAPPPQIVAPLCAPVLPTPPWGS